MTLSLFKDKVEIKCRRHAPFLALRTEIDEGVARQDKERVSLELKLFDLGLEEQE
jgi:hypothetical protein